MQVADPESLCTPPLHPVLLAARLYQETQGHDTDPSKPRPIPWSLLPLSSAMNTLALGLEVCSGLDKFDHDR